ncbi:unnamed protein product, partial [Didymodactylos carnosus]
MKLLWTFHSTVLCLACLTFSCVVCGPISADNQQASSSESASATSQQPQQLDLNQQATPSSAVDHLSQFRRESDPSLPGNHAFLPPGFSASPGPPTEKRVYFSVGRQNDDSQMTHKLRHYEATKVNPHPWDNLPLMPINPGMGMMGGMHPGMLGGYGMGMMDPSMMAMYGGGGMGLGGMGLGGMGFGGMMPPPPLPFHDSDAKPEEKH